MHACMHACMYASCMDVCLPFCTPACIAMCINAYMHAIMHTPVCNGLCICAWFMPVPSERSKVLYEQICKSNNLFQNVRFFNPLIRSKPSTFAFHFSMVTFFLYFCELIWFFFGNLATGCKNTGAHIHRHMHASVFLAIEACRCRHCIDAPLHPCMHASCTSVSSTALF